MIRPALPLCALALAGCVTAGPSYSPQELAAVRSSVAQNDADARAHKITWTEAARREVATARQVGGARVTPDDELSFSLRTALAAEVDAGRMTPEMADFKYQQHMAERRATLQAQQAEEQRRFSEAMLIAGQAMQNAGQAYQTSRPVNCTSNQVGTYTYTNCY